MSERLPGFKGEYLWELDIAEHHLLAIANAIGAERYDWRPAEDARSVSEVFVHVAAGNLALLGMVGVPLPEDLYPPSAGDPTARFFALVMKNQEYEKTVRAKADVVKMLRTSLSATRDAFVRATAEDLDTAGAFFGEQTTVRRAYLRLLTHTHEHMGQLIGYVRAMGLPAPWPDPMDWVRAQAVQGTGA